MEERGKSVAMPPSMVTLAAATEADWGRATLAERASPDDRWQSWAEARSMQPGAFLTFL